MKKIGYGQVKGLATELLRGGNIDRLCSWVGIDRSRISRRRAHFLPTSPLRRTRHVALEARHARNDNFVAVGLEHMVTQAAANRRAQHLDAFQEFRSDEPGTLAAGSGSPGLCNRGMESRPARRPDGTRGRANRQDYGVIGPHVFI